MSARALVRARLAQTKAEFSAIRRIPNLARYELGETISDLGSEATSFVLMTYVYLETGSLVQFALLFALDNLPDVVLSPIVGEITDRVNRRKLLIAADAALAGVTLAAMVLALTDNLSVMAVYFLVIIGACFDVVVDSAAEAMYQEMVPPENLVQTGALLGSAGELVDIIGPAVGVALLAIAGTEAVFIFDLITFAFGLSMLRRMRPSAGSFDPRHDDNDDEDDDERLFREGIRFLRRNRTARLIVSYGTLDGFLSSLVVLMVAVVALESGEEAHLAFVQGSAGLGSILGMALIAVFGLRRAHVVRDNIAIPGLISGAVLLIVAFTSTIGALVVAAFILLVLAAPLDAAIDAMTLTSIPKRVIGRVSAVEDVIDGLANLFLLLALTPVIEYFADNSESRRAVYMTVIAIAGVLYLVVNSAAIRLQHDPDLASIGTKVAGVRVFPPGSAPPPTHRKHLRP